VLTVTGFIFLFVLCAAGIVALPAFGYIWWTFTAVAAALMYLIFRRKRGPVRTALTGRQRWLGRIHRGARLLFVGVLACWLGLIVWSMSCAGGPQPPAKADPA